MKNLLFRALRVWVLIGWVGVVQPVDGVIIPDERGQNTSPPSGALEGSGWDYQGRWGGFLGTAISRKHFVTAAHIGGSVGNTFSYRGNEYRTIAKWDNPDSDLRVWEVGGTFDRYASLYTGNNELGMDLVVFGRGTDRGDPVVSNGVHKGWRWGPSDQSLSWGQNTIDSVFNAGKGVGDLLGFMFDVDAGPYEAHLTLGDSGGAVFVNDGGTWKLAGINYASTGPYREYPGGPIFDASLLDQGGLFINIGPDRWVQVPDRVTDLPGSSFATRISSHTGWINSVIPEPTSGMIVAGGVFVIGGYRPRGMTVGW